jgi:hypothetical protein
VFHSPSWRTNAVVCFLLGGLNNLLKIAFCIGSAIKPRDNHRV